MTMRWKRILYWFAIIVTVMPVLYIDIAYLSFTRFLLEHNSLDTVVVYMLIGAFIMLIAQIMGCVCFIRASRAKDFRRAYKWLLGFAATGGLTLLIFINFANFVFT